jgi:hypothetical protein
MGVSIKGPRLSQRDVRDLRGVAEQLAALNHMLTMTTWQGAPVARVLLDQIYPKVVGLYNRGERILPKGEWILGAETAPGAPQETSADENATPAANSEPGEPDSP